MESAKDALILAQQRELDYLHSFLEAHLPRLEISKDGLLMTLYGSVDNIPRKLEMQRDKWRFSSNCYDDEWFITVKMKHDNGGQDVSSHSFRIERKLPHKDAELELSLCRQSCMIYTSGPSMRYPSMRYDVFDWQRYNPLFLERVETMKQTLQAQFERWYPTEDPVAHD